MPESRHRYLYERLGDHDFQQLVGALLVNQFSDYIPIPLPSRCGGANGLRAVDPSKVMVYQVKWSVNGCEKNPVSWLEQVVKKEADNLRRLAEEGVRHYALVTNVPSTAKDETGTFDKLDQKLRGYAKEFGYEQMTCFWREALNPWVDNAPAETKWAYADMLAGWDLIRYIVAEQIGTNEDKVHRALIRKVVAAQWEDDQRVKFSQSEVDRERVVDLFVDVTAQERHHALARQGVVVEDLRAGRVGAGDLQVVQHPRQLQVLVQAVHALRSRQEHVDGRGHERKRLVHPGLCVSHGPTLTSPHGPVTAAVGALWTTGAAQAARRPCCGLTRGARGGAGHRRGGRMRCLRRSGGWAAGRVRGRPGWGSPRWRVAGRWGG